MQSIDNKNNVVNSQIFDFANKITALETMQNELEKDEVEYLVVGNLPQRGEIVEVNGLRYRVIMQNEKKRRMTLEMI